MSIRKPVDGTVRADDFRDKTYSFVVESVLGPEESPGIVLLSTSVGYLLTTSGTDQPKREQVLRYNRQSDGSWLASAVVTLLFTQESPIDGTVVIRDSSAETVVLTVNTVSTSLSRLSAPLLTVSEPVLTFAGTSPGEPSFQVLTIAQQRSGAPVTLTTDAPDYFQFASDSRPAFAPSLTLTPSPLGTHVHVRYVANKYGAHTGRLTIQSSAGNETVTLNGRNAGLLTVLKPTNQAKSTGRRAGLLALTLAVGLAYAGYSNRCQLFPALCQDATPEVVVTDMPVLAPVSGSGSNNLERKEVTSRKRRRTTVVQPTEPSGRQAPERARVDRPADQRISESTINVTNEQNSVSSSRNVARSLSNPKSANQVTADTVAKRPRRRVLTPIPPTHESELERELNGNSQN